MRAQLFQIQPMGIKVSKSLFFAYGSDMHPVQIQKRCAHPERVATACLAGFRLGFYGHNPAWDSGYETAVPAPGGRLWGVVYALSNSDWERLDQWQDARMDGAGIHYHYPATVCDAQGERYETRTYQFDVRGAATQPSAPYLEFLLAGARANGLPQDYVDSLAAIAAAPAHYAVPRSTSFVPSLGDSCEGCAGA
jgi:gamma-glutamylcyclotransferase (GGCT)/AIG2-like uncharacterized protein YtfP